jgi:pyrimidine operon attenuation protein/uracil phosphoribosyltransferase
MTEDDLRRVLSRMAHQVLERHKGVEDLVLAGIPTRGLPLAQRLAQRLRDLEGDAVPVVCLDPRPFRDDRASHSNDSGSPAPLSAPVAGRKVIIIDDVLFTGRTSRAALDALTHAPGAIEGSRWH